jgi:hypothetical protein
VHVIASAGKRSLIDRMVGAALLEPEAYQEAAMVPSTRVHATLVVGISAAAAGLGGLSGGLTGLVLGSLAAVFGWGLYCFAVSWAATNRFGVPRTAANWGATWRTLALASSPRVFLVLTFLPAVGFLVGLAVHAWVLITTVLAVREALDLEARPAIATAVIGMLPMLLVWALTAALV